MRCGCGRINWGRYGPCYSSCLLSWGGLASRPRGPHLSEGSCLPQSTASPPRTTVCCPPSPLSHVPVIRSSTRSIAATTATVGGGPPLAYDGLCARWGCSGRTKLRRGWISIWRRDELTARGAGILCVKVVNQFQLLPSVFLVSSQAHTPPHTHTSQSFLGFACD